MKWSIRLIAVALLALVSIGCVNLTMSDRECLREMQYVGIDVEEYKSPPTAGLLNILPGIGNFYLGQVGFGVMNLLLWPFSIVWGIPQAWIDAGDINRKQTVEYYFHTRTGIARICQQYQLLGVEPPPYLNCGSVLAPSNVNTISSRASDS